MMAKTYAAVCSYAKAFEQVFDFSTQMLQQHVT